jgi:hypothetical protein
MIAPAIVDIRRTRARRGHCCPNKGGHGDADEQDREQHLDFPETKIFK